MSDLLPTSADADLAPEERRLRIVEMLGRVDRLTVADLVRHFATSEDSIRRDLRRLAADGLIHRVHGAARAPALSTPPVEIRATARLEEKRAIAEVVVAEFRDGATILIGGGTTALAIARAIPAGRRLTVVTTAPAVALEFIDRPLVETILVGGRLDPPSGTAIGARALETLAEIRADLAVVVACSIDVEQGVTMSRHEEAFVVRAMLAVSARSLLVATAEKLATTSPHWVGAIDRFDGLVTADDADPDDVAALRAAGLPVTLVPPG